MVCSYIQFVPYLVYRIRKFIHQYKNYIGEQTGLKIKWSFYHPYIISRCWRDFFFFSSLFIATFCLFVRICLLRGILETLSSTIKPCCLTLSWLHVAQNSALPSHCEGKTCFLTLPRICSSWIDSHSAVACSCCLMQSLNLKQIPKGFTESSKCLSRWNTWELSRRLEHVLRWLIASPWLMTVAPNHRTYFIVRMRLTSFIFVLGISAWRVKAGHSCASTSLLWLRECLAHDILSFSIIITFFTKKVLYELQSWL